eukprot:125048-Pleurochrysis_carterae.AAC.1
MSDYVYGGVSPLSFRDEWDYTSHSQNDGTFVSHHITAPVLPYSGQLGSEPARGGDQANQHGRGCGRPSRRE